MVHITANILSYPGAGARAQGVLFHSSVSSHYSGIQEARTYTVGPHYPVEPFCFIPSVKWFIYRTSSLHFQFFYLIVTLSLFIIYKYATFPDLQLQEKYCSSVNN